MDSDGDTTLGLNEFITFIRVIKVIEKKCKADPGFENKAFPPEVVKRIKPEKDADSWESAMARADEDMLDSAWDSILKYLAVPAYKGEMNKELVEENSNKLRKVFGAYDSDHSGSLELHELTTGLLSSGVLVNTRQAKALEKTLDKNGDNLITFDELLKEVNSVVKSRSVRGREKVKKEAEEILRRASMQKDGDSTNTGLNLTPSQTLESALNKAAVDLSTEEVINCCSRGIAQRVFLELSGYSSNIKKDAETEALAQLLEGLLAEGVRRFHSSNSSGEVLKSGQPSLPSMSSQFLPLERPVAVSSSPRVSVRPKLANRFERKLPFGRAATPPGRPDKAKIRIPNCSPNKGAHTDIVGPASVLPCNQRTRLAGLKPFQLIDLSVLSKKRSCRVSFLRHGTGRWQKCHSRK
jgi:Ca2+-binding EF-hand superfamily protein